MLTQDVCCVPEATRSVTKIMKPNATKSSSYLPELIRKPLEPRSHRVAR